MKIIKGAMVKIKGVLSNGLYILGSIVVGYLTVASFHDQQLIKLWHARLGHVSERGLKKLHK